MLNDPASVSQRFFSFAPRKERNSAGGFYLYGMCNCNKRSGRTLLARLAIAGKVLTIFSDGKVNGGSVTQLTPEELEVIQKLSQKQVAVTR